MKSNTREEKNITPLNSPRKSKSAKKNSAVVEHESRIIVSEEVNEKVSSGLEH